MLFDAGNLTVKGKRKVQSDEIESIITKNGGKVIKDFRAKFPSEIIGTVVTVQRAIQKEGAKLSKGILTAYRRKWKFVSPYFFLQYKDSDTAHVLEDNRSNFLLDLQHLDELPETSLAKVAISNLRHHLLDSKEVSAHRKIKSILREKPVKKKKSEVTTSIKKFNVAGYPSFVKENYHKIREETGIQKMTVLSKIVSDRWKLLSVEEKERYSAKTDETDSERRLTIDKQEGQVLEKHLV